MTTLICALATAHGALVTQNDTTLASTARKVEGTLVEQVKTLKPEEFTREIVTALLNSGSLKALKLAPETQTAITPVYGNPGPNPSYIMSRPKTYLREALKRGFKLNESVRLDMVLKIAKGQTTDIQNDTLLEGPVTPYMADKLLEMAISLPKEDVQKISDIVVKMLKSALKDYPEQMSKTNEGYYILHDPAMAGPLLYKAMAAHALLGTKKPKQDAIEHKDLEDLARTLFSTAGRKEFKTKSGGLQAWLDQGAPLPSVFTTVETKRTRYSTTTRRFF